jgi:protein-L-isoaspartate(D-aspartate) O-methyltransferase
MARSANGNAALDEARLAAAREALVQSLADEIRDERVLEAFRKVPRERFVPVGARHLAYVDRPLSIGHGQTISQPRMVAIMLQEMRLSGDEKVLDVGSGSGYQAALLGQLAREVIGVELIPELAERSRRVLRDLGYANVRIFNATDQLGWPDEAPYDAIVVGAGAPRVPMALVEQLAMGGRLVIPVGDRHQQELMVVEKRPEGLRVSRKGACRFVPLIGKEAYAPEED